MLLRPSKRGGCKRQVPCAAQPAQLCHSHVVYGDVGSLQRDVQKEANVHTHRGQCTQNGLVRVNDNDNIIIYHNFHHMPYTICKRY